MTHSPSPVERLLEIMAKLRDKDSGCPWDVEQDFRSILPYTIEEAYEVADAIERNDKEDLKSELGDLLLQVVFHAQMAKEEGWFDFHAVAEGIAEKMIRRHPHVFGDAQAEHAEAVTTNWETIKQQERDAKKNTGILDDVPLALPALLRAEKLQKRAARVGFDWPHTAQVIDKIKEELEEVEQAIASDDNNHIKEEIGDLLFVVANLAHKLKVDPEDALRDSNRKFERRFHYIEQSLETQNKSLDNSSLEEMDALWNQAKKEEKQKAKKTA